MCVLRSPARELEVISFAKSRWEFLKWWCPGVKLPPFPLSLRRLAGTGCTAAVVVVVVLSPPALATALGLRAAFATTFLGGQLIPLLVLSVGATAEVERLAGRAGVAVRRGERGEGILDKEGAGVGGVGFGVGSNNRSICKIEVYRCTLAITAEEGEVVGTCVACASFGVCLSP